MWLIKHQMVLMVVSFRPDWLLNDGSLASAYLTVRPHVWWKFICCPHEVHDALSWKLRMTVTVNLVHVSVSSPRRGLFVVSF